MKNKDDVVIGVDVDGVLCNTRAGIISEIEQTYDITIDRPLYGSNPDIPQIDSQLLPEVRDILEHKFDIYSSFNPVEGSVEALNTLNEKYTVHIITHRVIDEDENRDGIGRVTRTWLKENGFNYTSFIDPTPRNKFQVKNIDVLIDDSIENLLISQDNSDRHGIHFLRPHNIHTTEPNITLASDYTNDSREDISKNPRKQWDTIANQIL